MKLAPQAVDLENAVIGALLLEQDAYDKVSGILSPESFYMDSNAKIFAVIRELADAHMPIDMLTIADSLKNKNILEEIGGVYQLTKLTNSVVSSANIESHAHIVAEKYLLRSIIRLSSSLIESAYNNVDAIELLDKAEREMLKLGYSVGQGSVVDINLAIKQALTKIAEWSNSSTSVTGITSGISELDRATRGWQNGDLVIIAARPSAGKTAFALNLIRNAAILGGKSVAIFSLEMKAVYLVLRMLAAESDVFLHKIQTGRLNPEDMEKIEKAVKSLSKSKIFFDDSSVNSIRTLKAKARRLKKKQNLGLMVVDYLQLMQGDGKGNREQDISTISRELKNLAQELDIPIIALSQLSREGVKSVSWDIAPPPSALRESGAIEQDADLILMLWGATDTEIHQNPELEGKRRLRIVKQRNGVLLTIDLDFKTEIQLFKSILEPINAF